jgi:hypothetical protein
MSQLDNGGKVTLFTHYICLCDGDNNLDVTLQSENEEPSVAEAQLFAALRARHEKRNA